MWTLEAVLDAVAREFQNAGSIDTDRWIRVCPSHSDVVIDFISALRLQGDVFQEPSVLKRWRDDGGAVADVLKSIRNDPVYAEAELGQRLAVARKKRQRKPKRPKFGQAAVFAWAFDVLRGHESRETIYATGKATYVLDRALDLGLFEGYRQMAYGPYDPQLKYGAVSRIAVGRRWFNSVEGGSAIEVGENLEEADKFARRYLRDEAVARELLEYLRSFEFKSFELLTTVLWATDRLIAEGRPLGAASIREWLGRHWPEKLERPQFSLQGIRNSLMQLSRLKFLPPDAIDTN